MQTARFVTLTESSVVRAATFADGALLWSVPFTEGSVTTQNIHDARLDRQPRARWSPAPVHRRMAMPSRSAEQGDGWQAAPAWSNRDVTMYMTSPVLAAGILYGHSSTRAGQFVALRRRERARVAVVERGTRGRARFGAAGGGRPSPPADQGERSTLQRGDPRDAPPEVRRSPVSCVRGRGRRHLGGMPVPLPV